MFRDKTHDTEVKYYYKDCYAREIILTHSTKPAGLKVSTAAIKNSTNKLKGQLTPKRKTTKLGTDSHPNIPANEEKSRGWGYVKSKFLTDNKKKGTTGKTE